MPIKNYVTIEGFACSDPDVKHREFNGEDKAVCEMQISYQHKKKKVSYITCVFWERQAEALQRTIRKGDLIRVDGYLKQEKWKDKEDNSREKLKIVVSSFAKCVKTWEEKPVNTEEGEPASGNDSDIPF